MDGIRQGKTFVTNGPVLEFRVQSQGMGAEVLLKKPTSVLVEARVRFDPARDDVKRLEVIQNGDLLRSFPREGPSPEIRCRFEAEISRTSWLAVRASGHKRGETPPPEGFLPPYRDRYRGAAASLAHSAAIYVTIENTPGLSQHSKAKSLARAWIARLQELEMRLAEDKIQYLARGTGRRCSRRGIPAQEPLCPACRHRECQEAFFGTDAMILRTACYAISSDGLQSFFVSSPKQE